MDCKTVQGCILRRVSIARYYYLSNDNPRDSVFRYVILYITVLALAVETEEKRNRFEQTSRTLQRKISMRSTKDQLVKNVLMPVKHNNFSCGIFRMSKRCLHMMEKLSSSEEL
ncbi:hypothetical protein TNCV_2475701 [Trichonephila clavipes]|nr:hypothetical protein TNCV_2475701 [Trichonephila clavipes]